MKATKRRTLISLLAASLALPMLAPLDTAHAADRKPNIVFILMDNLGYGELGVYGGGITRGALFSIGAKFNFLAFIIETR